MAVLHPSVAVRWWLRDRSAAAESTRFLHEVLAPGIARLLVVEGIELRVLDDVARDVATVALDPEIAELLVDEIDRQVRLLCESGVAFASEQRPLVRSSFVLAARHGIALYDAQTVNLAETTRLPLLVADRDQYEILPRVAIGRPMLRLLWLPHHLDELDRS